MWRRGFDSAAARLWPRRWRWAGTARSSATSRPSFASRRCGSGPRALLVLALYRCGRQAEALAGDYADGVCWCELAPVADPAAVVHALSNAVGAQPRDGKTMEEAVFFSTRCAPSAC